MNAENRKERRSSQKPRQATVAKAAEKAGIEDEASVSVPVQTADLRVLVHSTPGHRYPGEGTRARRVPPKAKERAAVAADSLRVMMEATVEIM